MVRVLKAVTVASIALFFSLVAFGNMTDYVANWNFVQHVLSMDTTFKDPAIMWRAITDPAIQAVAYKLIIAWELLTAAICWVASVLMLKNSLLGSVHFQRAKTIAIFGLFLGFLLYMVGFIDIGGEWFAMWQSSSWNGQEKAGLFITIILLALIFVSMREE